MLKGKRVTLRAPQREDLKPLHKLNQNIELAILGGGDWRPEALAGWEKEFDRHLDDQEHGFFIIEADGKVIGDIGMHSIDPRSRVTSFGIYIGDDEYVGKGYGREALNLFLDWTFNIQNFVRVWLITWASNERAIRAYRAVGFAEEGRLRKHIFVDGEYVDVVCMGVQRDEWQGLKQ